MSAAPSVEAMLARWSNPHVRPLLDRFNEKVERRGREECWPWLGSCSGGYGYIRHDGRTIKATHVALDFEGIVVPRGSCVLHSCDNPPCCNPRHLRVGTQLENIAERHARGRNGRCPGEAHGRAKLTADDVARIREMRLQGVTLVALAVKFGVSFSLIASIAKRRIWRHLP